MSIHDTPEHLESEWSRNPEPMKHTRDPRTIIEQPTQSSKAYVWNSANEENAWLEFDGEPIDIEE